jgi:chemotaxis response regulator CheB
MTVERPRLVIAIGSSGGYEAFAKSMRYVDPDASRAGAIYLAEHVGDDFLGRAELLNASTRMGRDFVRAEDGMRLEKGGLYFQSRIYQECGKGNPLLVIGQNGDEQGPRFVGRPPHGYRMGMDFTLESALEADYWGDLMIVGLSGCGGDGSRALGRVKELDGRGGGYPRIIIQEPKSARMPQMPLKMMLMARFLGIPHRIYRPKKIGREINRFFEEARPQER